MFFSQKITRIKHGDLVLEIGPGADPHPRSDVFLELKLDDERLYEKQFGHNRKLNTDKPIVYYDGEKFPFADHEFDYVICSHVLEHVHDVSGFLSEVFRVARQGYFEYPLITYEYQFNFDVHISYLKWNGSKMLYMNKSETPINSFRPVQQLLLQTLEKGYVQVIQKIPHLYIEGFEWNKPFEAETVKNMELLLPDPASIPIFEANRADELSVKTLVAALLRKVTRKIS